MRKLLRVKVSFVDILISPSIAEVDVLTVLYEVKRMVSILGMSTLLYTLLATTDHALLDQTNVREELASYRLAK